MALLTALGQTSGHGVRVENLGDSSLWMQNRPTVKSLPSSSPVRPP
ncbi:MAG: hypothetical protein ACLU9S_20810 [Oscillospiraceae bacterium]